MLGKRSSHFQIKKMVWALFRIDPPPGERDYYFFKSGCYKVGRKGCDVIVNDKGVSRIHAEILMDEMSYLDNLLLSDVHIRDCSKYGTFIKKDPTEKVHEFPNKETVLRDGDLVSFGTGNATYRFSTLPRSHLWDLLGASVTEQWSLDCSHVLVDDSFPLNEDLIDAIVARKPLVRFSWVELIAGKSICTDIPSCDSHAANLMLEGESVKVADPRSRESCLKGYSFLLKPEKEYKFEGRLQSLLEVGGANVCPTEMENEGDVITVVPAGASSFSSPWVRSIDLVSAVLMGYLHPSLIKSVSGIDYYVSIICPRSNTFGSGVRVNQRDLLNLKDLPDFGPRDYTSLPVDVFGKAYLQAFGHHIKEGNIFQSAAGLPERMGLGYVPPKVPEDVVHQLPSQDEDQRNIIYADPTDKLNLLLDSLASSDVLNQGKAANEIRVLIKKQPSLRAVFGVCSDAVTKLLNPLSGDVNMHPELQEDLITTVLNISIHHSNKKLVAQNPIVIPLLVQSLKFGTLRTRSNSAAALSTLSALDSNKYVIMKAGALKPLIDLLDEGEVSAMNDAASAIFSLIVVHKNKGEAISEGIIKVILKKLRYRILVDELLAILTLLSSHHKAINEMLELGVVSCLRSIIKEDTSDHYKENCITILYTVCYNYRRKLKEIWVEEGNYGIISNLARSRTSKAKQKANDLLKEIHRYVSCAHTTPG